jgi:putative membrane protein
MLLDKKIPFPYVFNKISRDLIFLIAVAVVFNYLANKLYAHLPEMPLNVPTFLGTAISILLSFKMSQSYDRWWEARKIWGAIVNDSRSFVLQLQSLVIGVPLSTIEKIALRQVAWCHSLGQSLRGIDPLENMGQHLDPKDIDAISKQTNKPLALLQLNAADIKGWKQDGQIDSIQHVQLDQTLVRLCDSMGKAERINSTVFPVTYRMFLHFAIYLFVITLSIALRNIDPLFEIPLLVLISAVFLLLEKTAYHLQDPFRNRPSDIPVTAIARTIEINIKQLLNLKNIPAPATSDTFYLL